MVEPSLPVPKELEVMIVKITDSEKKGLLCVGCYRLSAQGTTLLYFLTMNLDSMMTGSEYEFSF